MDNADREAYYEQGVKSVTEDKRQTEPRERWQGRYMDYCSCYLTWGVALLLFFAAGMKAWQLATVPVWGEGLLHARWLNIITVEFELCIGVWLLTGLYPKQTRWVTIALFTTFAGVSLYKALSGEASCGCFGAATVSPWFTRGLDVVVAGLAFFLGCGQQVALTRVDLPYLDKRRVVWAVVAWLIMAIPATKAMFSIQTNDLSELGTVFTGADGKETILLEPEKWVGKVFPLIPLIEPTEVLKDILEGEGLILLYHDDCEKCLSVISDYEQVAVDSSISESGIHFALLGIPPFKKKQLSGRIAKGLLRIFFRKKGGSEEMACVNRTAFLPSD